MPRSAYRFISKLTNSQIQQLQQLRDFGKTRRLRQRAHAILLSYEGMEIHEIAKIFQANRNTVSSWLDRWEAGGIDELADKPRSGASPTLTESEQKKAIRWLQQTPQSSAKVLEKIRQKLGKQISDSTLKRIAKKHDLRWKRARKSLRGKRDEKNFASQA